MRLLRMVVLHGCTFGGGLALFGLMVFCAHRASPETAWIIAGFAALILFVLIYLSVDRDKKIALLDLAGELGKAGVAITEAKTGLFGGGLGFGVQPSAPTPKEDADRQRYMGGGE